MDHTDFRGRHSEAPLIRYSVTLAPDANTAERILMAVDARSAPAAKRKARKAYPSSLVTRCVALGRA